MQSLHYNIIKDKTNNDPQEEKQMEKINLAHVVEKFLMEKKCHFDDIYQGFADCLVCIKITGDWKHDHLRTKILLEENFNVLLHKEDAEPSEEDFYTAVHTFMIKD